MSETQICGVVLPLDVAYQARIVAATEGKSRSCLMRELLLDYLEQQKIEELQAHLDSSKLAVSISN